VQIRDSNINGIRQISPASVGIQIRIAAIIPFIPFVPLIIARELRAIAVSGGNMQHLARFYAP
jgi:hypothetical protein